MSEKKQRIYDAGKELFCLQGFKDTNVSQITKKAGMSTGSFYNYYSSKDQLFMEIFLDENVKLKKQILNAVNLNAAPQAVINELITLNMQGMMENPILKEWYNRESFQKIEQVCRIENNHKHFNFMYDGFIDVIRKWQMEGIFRKDIDAEIIMSMFVALINIDTHKEEIGLPYFPQVLEYIGAFIIKGLTDF